MREDAAKTIPGTGGGGKVKGDDRVAVYCSGNVADSERTLRAAGGEDCRAHQDDREREHRERR
jgi:hypothetical protein